MVQKINTYSTENKKNQAQGRNRLRNRNYPRTLKVPHVPLSFPVVTKIRNFNHSPDFCDGPLCIFLNNTLLNFAHFLHVKCAVLLCCELHPSLNTLCPDSSVLMCWPWFTHSSCCTVFCHLNTSPFHLSFYSW